MLRLLALGAVLFVALPTAAEMTLAMETSGGPIKPGAETRAVEAVVTVDCATLLARTVGAPATLTMAFTAPSSIVVTGPSSERFVAEDCPLGTETLTRRLPYQVTVARGTPGFVDLQVQAEASFEPHASDAIVGGTPAARAAFTVTPGAELSSEIQLSDRFKVCGCPVTFDLAATNLGNVRTRYSFELSSAPAAGTVTLPEPFEIDPSTAGSTSTGTAKILFQAPAGSWPGEVVFAVTVRSAAAADPGVTGGPLTANMLVRNSAAGSQGAPGLDPAVVVLAVASVASVAARRRA